MSETVYDAGHITGSHGRNIPAVERTVFASEIRPHTFSTPTSPSLVTVLLKPFLFNPALTGENWKTRDITIEGRAECPGRRKGARLQVDLCLTSTKLQRNRIVLRLSEGSMRTRLK